MDRITLKKELGVKRKEDPKFVQAEKKVQLLLIVMTFLKIIDCIWVTWIAGFQFSVLLNTGVFCLFAAVVRSGIRFPLYLWIIGTALNVPMILESFQFFGLLLVIDLLLLYEPIMLFINCLLTLLLLFHPTFKYYFDEIRFLKLK